MWSLCASPLVEGHFLVQTGISCACHSQPMMVRNVNGMRIVCALPGRSTQPDDNLVTVTLKHSRRPRVGLQKAHNLSDIQRFYIVMAPTSRKAPMRLAAVGKKQLPNTGGRFWACIQGLSDKVAHVPKLACSYDMQPPPSTLGPLHYCGPHLLGGWATNEVPGTKGATGPVYGTV